MRQNNLLTLLAEFIKQKCEIGISVGGPERLTKIPIASVILALRVAVMNRHLKLFGRRGLVASAVLAVVAAFHSSASYGQFTLTEVTRFNLNTVLSSTTGTTGAINPNFIGNNVSSVAWNGSRLFVAGMKNGGTGTSAAIVEVLNTNTTGVVISTSVQYGTRLGFTPIVDQRGYTGLAIQGNRLFSALDTGAVQPNALRGYDVTTQTTGTLWSTPVAAAPASRSTRATS